MDFWDGPRYYKYWNLRNWAGLSTFQQISTQQSFTRYQKHKINKMQKIAVVSLSYSHQRCSHFKLTSILFAACWRWRHRRTFADIRDARRGTHDGKCAEIYHIELVSKFVIPPMSPIANLLIFPVPMSTSAATQFPTHKRTRWTFAFRPIDRPTQLRYWNEAWWTWKRCVTPLTRISRQRWVNTNKSKRIKWNRKCQKPSLDFIYSILKLNILRTFATSPSHASCRLF